MKPSSTPSTAPLLSATAYGGARNETPKHIELMKKHHWSDLFDVDIMDAEGPDVEWPVENGKVRRSTTWARTLKTTTVCWFLSTLRVTPWAATAVR